MSSLQVLINKGRLKSMNQDLNFLAKQGNIYIMDNHLAAFWCWCQELDALETISLLHIDRHHDVGEALVKLGFHQYKNTSFTKLSIHQAIALTVNNLPFFQWDNYIRLYNAFFPYSITNINFVTMQKLPSDYRHHKRIGLKEWIKDNSWLPPNALPTIINLDIDVFFTNGRHKRVLSNQQFREFAIKLSKLINHAKVVTIALSPECCGGWDNSIEVCKKLLDLLQIEFIPTIIGSASEI
jgi:hypothetical protein